MNEGDPIRYVQRLKVVLLVSSLISLVLLLLSAFEENLSGEWRGYQKEYRAALVANADNEQVRAAAERMDIGFQQLFLSDLDRVDRCVTCHIGVDDPSMAEAELPLRAHSGKILQHHPADKFGCTVCHEGQGRAVDADAAHGNVPHWPSPLVAGEATYTSCGKCHYENDLYGAEYDLYATTGPLPPLNAAELDASVPGIEADRGRAIERGKQLVLDTGCLGCHSYRGRGGTLGPDITYIGEKTAHDFDFSHDEGDHTVANWLYEHFKRPGEVVPGTLMPDIGVSDRQAHDLTQYMLSLRRKAMPAAYTPVPPRRASHPVDGERLFSMFCNSCHGEQGQGSMVLDPELMMLADPPEELMTPALNNADTLAVASDDYLYRIITHGRGGTNMIGWSSGLGGLSDDEIDELIRYMRGWEHSSAPLESISATRGDARRGRALYRSRCLGCHGAQGEGGIGVALNSPSFLTIASDTFLARSIIEGRPNTAMPSWKQLEADEVSDLLAFIRSWEQQPADRDEVLARVEATGTPSHTSLRIGQSLYRSNCAVCHGHSGEGAMGPSVSNESFLSIVDNGYLFDAIVHGRPGTAMPAWSHLSEDDVVDLIVFMRQWNSGHRRHLQPFLASGDWQHGELIFEGSCASCHGAEGVGATGPQLNNPVFLSSASDAMLREWISHGKPGTEMLGFAKGEQGMVDLTDSQIEDVVTYLRHLEFDQPSHTARPGMGIVSLGAEMYAMACGACHGPNGEGGTGSALSNPQFLQAASDGYLQATIVMGRDGTAMRPMAQGAGGGNVELTAEDINNVVAFMRSWEHHPPVTGIPHRFITAPNIDDGEELYAGHCAGCHGVNGNEGWAPALNNVDFLTAATDGFLQATIARGRANTPMRPYGIGGEGLADLTSDQINNIVVYIRTWAPLEEGGQGELAAGEAQNELVTTGQNE